MLKLGVCPGGAKDISDLGALPSVFEGGALDFAFFMFVLLLRRRPRAMLSVVRLGRPLRPIHTVLEHCQEFRSVDTCTLAP